MSYSIDDKVFSGNLFWSGGDTHTLRLDEIRAMQERTLANEEIMVGDTSARDIAEQLFKNSGMLGKPRTERLIEVVAQALLDEVGDSPTGYLNEHHGHEVRTRQMAALGNTVDIEPPRDRGLVSGYQKPENPDKVNYGDLSVDELKTKLSERNLPVSGNKAELINRLEADDLTNPDVDNS